MRSTLGKQLAREVEEIEFLPVAANETRRRMRRLPKRLQLMELRVVQRRAMLQRRDHRRRQTDPLNRHHPTQPVPHPLRRRTINPTTCRRHPAARAENDRAHRLRDRCNRLRAYTPNAGQERPLVLDRLQCRRVQEHLFPSRRAVRCSGSAIRFPNEPFGMKSCDGSNRSYEARSISARNSIAARNTPAPSIRAVEAETFPEKNTPYVRAFARARAFQHRSRKERNARKYRHD